MLNLLNLLNLFHHSISFHKADPLGGGLREEISAEQMQPEAITLEDGVVDGELESKWNSIQEDLQNDPEWIHFSED